MNEFEFFEIVDSYHRVPVSLVSETNKRSAMMGALIRYSYRAPIIVESLIGNRFDYEVVGNDYHYPHVVVDTVDERDITAVAKLVASEICLQAAANAADQKTSTLTADVVDHGQISNQWLRVAERLVSDYESHMNARYAPAGTFVQLRSRRRLSL